MGRRRTWPVKLYRLYALVRKLSMKVKTIVAVIIGLLMIVALKYMVKDHNHFFVGAEAVHFLGILVLIYKLTTHKTCSGLSLKSQELTATFLVVRLFSSLFIKVDDIHTVLDLSTLVSTLWVIYMMRYKLKSTYISELDSMPRIYLVVPCGVVALLVHPHTKQYVRMIRMLWAFCVYLEAVSVCPQLRMMQNAMMIESFTAHYVFAMGVSRFLTCAHWIIQVYETGGRYILLVGSGYIWLPMLLVAEIVQTFILADFCYYYIKSVVDGHVLSSLPLPV